MISETKRLRWPRPLRMAVVVAAVWVAVGWIGRAGGAEAPEEAAKQEAIRDKIPLGGNFEPKKEEGIFVAAGHGLNVVASRDDGKTWKQVFFGYPCGDHGRWAVWNSVAYTEGVFAIAAGWGGPGTVIASDDGVTWRHLTGGDRKPSTKGAKPIDLRNTMGLLGVRGAFVMPLQATPDFGKTWHEASQYGFTDGQGNRVKVDVAHASLAYGDYHGGRVIVVADSGPSLYSDDRGATWTPLSGKAQPWPDDKGGAQGIIAKGDVFIIVKGAGDTVLRSADGGATWTPHPLGVERPESRSFGLAIVKDEFWVTGKTSKASADGISWRDLPASTPGGRIAVSDKGTLISVSRSRSTILRSEDGRTWQEVYKFTPPAEATGGAQGLADVEFGLVKAVR